jgi:hypothetical protein
MSTKLSVITFTVNVAFMESFLGPNYFLATPALAAAIADCVQVTPG